MWLGHSQWNDRLFIGSLHELRLYDTALSAEEIALSYPAGADDLPVMAEPCPERLAGEFNRDRVMDIVDAAMLADPFLTSNLELHIE